MLPMQHKGFKPNFEPRVAERQSSPRSMAPEFHLPYVFTNPSDHCSMVIMLTIGK